MMIPEPCLTPGTQDIRGTKAGTSEWMKALALLLRLPLLSVISFSSWAPTTKLLRLKRISQWYFDIKIMSAYDQGRL